MARYHNLVKLLSRWPLKVGMMDDACTSIALSVPAKHCILMLPHCTYTDPL